MNRKMIIKLALAFMVSGAIASAQQVITFDDLPGDGPASIPSTYSGFTWNNFGYLNSAAYDAEYAPGGSGYYNGTVSPPNVAYPSGNIYGTNVSGSFSSGTPFNLISADITAAWYNSLSVEVDGYKGTNLVYSNTYTVNATGPSLIAFNYSNITSVEFTSYGGVYAGLGGSGIHSIALDNLTISNAPPAPPVVTTVLANIPNPVPGTTNFTLRFQFDRTMSPGITPQVLLTNSSVGALQSTVSTNGSWVITVATNDTYLTPPITFSPGMDGTNQVFVSGAQDTMGQVLALTNVYAVVVDATPPVITNVQTSPAITQCQVTWITDKPSSSQVEYGLAGTYGLTTPLDGSLVTNHTATIPGLQPVTVYHFRIHSKDYLGNEGITADATFTTLPDTVPPHTLITSGPGQNATVCSLPVTFAWSGTDNVSAPTNLVFAYQMDSDGYSSFSNATSASFGSLAQGQHTFQVEAMDQAGNVDPSPATVQFIVGNTAPPVISAIASTPGDDQALITWNTSEPSTSEVDYGLTSAYGSSTAGDSTLVTLHSYNLTGLLAATNYHFRVRSDNQCGVETVSADNVFETQPAPDLQVASVSIPQQAWTGRGFDVSWVLTNAGAGVATGPWHDRVYLSVTNQLQTNVDQVLGDFSFDGPLAPGQSVQLTEPVTINRAGVTNGLYYISVLADPSNEVFEVTKTNNVGVSTSNIFVQLTPLPALAVSSVDAPTNGIGGQPVGISWMVCNDGQGDTDVPTWYDHLYLSTTTNLTGVVADYGEFENPSYLAVGDCYEQDVTVTLPAGLSGPCYFIVNADATGVLNPNDITNSMASTAAPIDVQLVTFGFLHVSSVQVSPAPPTAVWAGGRVTVTWTVENIGQSEITGPWFNNVTLSPTPVYDFDHGYFDVTLGSTSGPLLPGQSYSSTNYFIVPIGITPGNWYAVTIPDAGYKAGGPQGRGRGTIGHDQNSALVVVSPPIPSDLVVTSVSAPAIAYAGQTINVTWVVSNDGLNGTSTSYWYDGVYLSTNGGFDTNQNLNVGYFAHYGALDIGASYTNNVTLTLPASVLPTGAANVTNYLFVYTDVGDVVVELTKTNNVLEAPSPLRILPAPPPRVDLAVASVSAPSTILAGGPANIFWTVTNEGTGVTGASNWVDSVYLSPGGPLNPKLEIWLADIVHNGALAPGNSYTVAQNINTPYCTTGSWFVVVVTDSGYQVNMSGAVTNNVLASPNPMRILPNNGARLEVSAVSSATSVTAGASLPVSWTVTNSGNSTASEPWVDGVYLSPKGVYLPGSAYLVGLYTNKLNLVSRGSYTQSRSYTIPPCLSGTYYVTVVADLSNVVDSISCDTNNFETSASAVQVAPVAYPSLQIAAMTVPAAVTSAVPWTVQWSVTNAGRGGATGTWFDAVYASLLPALDSSAILLGQFEHDGGLAANAAYNQNQLVQFPACLSGSYYIFVMADVSNAVNVAAVCQANNPARSTNALPVNLGLYPDLAVTAISFPTTAYSGQPMTVSWSVINAGLATASVPWVDAIYLSSRASFNAATAVLLGTYPQSAPLPPGASYTQTAPFMLPGTHGTFYVAVFTDATNAVQECQNETNNVTVSATTVNILPTLYPDLKVTAVQVPSAALAGQTINVSWVVTNEGTAATTPTHWTDAVFLSADEVLDPSDVRLGGFLNPVGLGVGQSYTNSASVVLPPGNAGPSYILVLADSAGVLFEHLGYNDSLGFEPNAMLVTLPPPADLAASNVTLAPASGVPGTQITIGWTVSNGNSNQTLGTWTDALYFSTNRFWDTTATLLTNLNHTALAASAGYNGSWTGPLPALTPGSYYAIVRADVRDTLEEANLSNNVAISPNTISVDVPVLVLGQSVTNQLTTGAVQYYKVNCPAGVTVRLTLAGSATNSANELYARFGAVPDLGNYDYIYNNVLAPNQQIHILSTQAGWYYVMVRGGNEPDGPSGYTLTAAVIPFGITSVAPNQIGDNGQVTIAISGAKFQPGATVQIASGTNLYSAETNFFFDATSLNARFLFTNAVHGTYDVVLTNPGNQSATATQAVTIVTALPLTAEVVPGFINTLPRVGLPFSWYGAVANIGNVDIQYLTVGIAEDHPFPISLTPPPGAVLADTNSTENSASACVFMVRDLPPAASTDFSFVISGFGSQGFHYYIIPTVQSKQDFLAQVADEAEDVRDYILTNAVVTSSTGTLPPDALAALPETNLWETYFAQGLVANGVLDAADLTSLPPPTGNNLLTASSSRLAPKDCASCSSNYKDSVIAVTAIFVLCELASEGIATPICVEGYETALTVIVTTYDVCNIRQCQPPPPDCADGSSSQSQRTPLVYAKSAAPSDQGGVFIPGGPGGFGGGPGGGGGGSGGGGPVCPQAPLDPNEKQGPAGYSAAGFVGSQVPWQYTIYFENTSNATAFARQVSITDVLDPSLDIRNFRVGQIAFGSVTITVPTNRTYYQTRVALPPPNPTNVVADITAGVDVQNGSLFWTMNAIDLDTGELLASTQEGILPPNTTNNIGAGYVTFSIKPRAGVPTGTVVTNQASIVFDTNDPLTTNPTTNTVDAVPPTSFVVTLPPVMNSNTFAVSWAGADDPGGSGVANYTIYVSDNGGPYELGLANSTTNSVQFTGQFGHTYAFYSTAQDNSGNTEAAHATPDTATLVSSPAVIAPVADQTINVGTAVIITNTVSEADQPASALAYSLGPNAPAGASVNPTNGVFVWTPECAQGSTTNLIELRVTAANNPSVTNSMLFNVVVGDCVQVGVGSTVVQTGQRATVPVNLFTTVGLTNLTFTLGYPTDRLTNWTISATNPVGSVGTAQMLGPSNTVFGLATRGGQVLQGPTVAGSITFSALPGPSAFIPLTVTNVAGTKADGSPAGNISGLPGRVVLVGPQSLLEAWLPTNHQRMLTLYGKPGASYEVDYSTNLLGANWKYAWRVPMTNLSEVFAANASLPQVFYRAFEFFADPPILAVGTAGTTNLTLLLYGKAGTNYVLEATTNLAKGAGWFPATSFALTNSFQFTNEGATTNQRMFFRAKRP